MIADGPSPAPDTPHEPSNHETLLAPMLTSEGPGIVVEVPPGWIQLRTGVASHLAEDIETAMRRVRRLGALDAELENDLRYAFEAVAAQAAGAETPVILLGVGASTDRRLFLGTLTLTCVDTHPSPAQHDIVMAALARSASDANLIDADRTIDTAHGPGMLRTTVHDATGVLPLSVTDRDRLFQTQCYTAVPGTCMVIITTATVTHADEVPLAASLAQRLADSFRFADTTTPRG